MSCNQDTPGAPGGNPPEFPDLRAIGCSWADVVVGLDRTIPAIVLSIQHPNGRGDEVLLCSKAALALGVKLAGAALRLHEEKLA